MKKELYLDISSENAGGSLYRLQKEDETGNSGTEFTYNHSTYNDDTDEVKVFETRFPDFTSFWSSITRDKKWHYLHPLYIHPEQREFVREQLKGVDWNVMGDKKWQESHQRQWKKVLSDPPEYYGGNK